MSEKTIQAAETFQNGFNCSQSVFSVFAEDFGLTKDNCLKLASPFGGGIARMQETCGAVTGAMMAIGLKYGKGENGTEEDKAAGYRFSQELIAKFSEKHGTIRCLDLLNHLNMCTAEGMTEIKKHELFRHNCSKYVQSAVEITESIFSNK